MKRYDELCHKIFRSSFKTYSADIIFQYGLRQGFLYFFNEKKSVILIFYLDFCIKFTVVYAYWPIIREIRLIWQNADIDYALIPFVNLGAKSQPNSFDAHRFETLCLQHTLDRLSLILQNPRLSSTYHRWN